METRIFGDLKPATVAEFAMVVNDYDLTALDKAAAGWHLLSQPQTSARVALRVAEGVGAIARECEGYYVLDRHMDREDTTDWLAWDRLRAAAYHKANRLSGSHDARGVWVSA